MKGARDLDLQEDDLELLRQDVAPALLKSEAEVAVRKEIQKVLHAIVLPFLRYHLIRE